jgi:hypothetical protein
MRAGYTPSNNPKFFFNKRGLQLELLRIPEVDVQHVRKKRSCLWGELELRRFEMGCHGKFLLF